MAVRRSVRTSFQAGYSVQQIVRDLIAQTDRGHQPEGGVIGVDAFLHYLVGATLEVARSGRMAVMQRPASGGEGHGRGGNFHLGDAVIYVSAAPDELLLLRSAEDLNVGLRPIILTTEPSIAIKFAQRRGFEERIAIHAVEQFVSMNVDELGLFTTAGMGSALRSIIERYNATVDAYETDPSFRIEW